MINARRRWEGSGRALRHALAAVVELRLVAGHLRCVAEDAAGQCLAGGRARPMPPLQSPKTQGMASSCGGRGAMGRRVDSSGCRACERHGIGSCLASDVST